MSSKKETIKTPFNERFSQLADILKRKYFITQNALAKKIGISGAALSDLISGKSKSAANTTLKALEIEYGVSSEWLTEGIGNPFRYEDGDLITNPFKPDEIQVVSHLKEVILEKDKKIGILKDQVAELKADKEELKADKVQLMERIAGLEADKEELKTDKEAILAEFSELKKEMVGLEKRQTGA